jgi:hypothetical protein
MSLGTFIISLEIISMAVEPRYNFAGNVFHGWEARVSNRGVHSCEGHNFMGLWPNSVIFGSNEI